MAEEYGLEPPTKGYPKHKLLPQLEEEAVEPTLPAQDEDDRPPRGRDKMAYETEYQPAPPCQFTMARGNTQDLRDILENNAGQPISIYGSRGAPQHMTMTVMPDTLIISPARPKHVRPNLVRLRRDIARHRGSAHPLCFTDEVMDHES